MDWWQKRQNTLRRQLVVNVVTMLFMSSLVESGVRDHHRVGLVIGVIGLLVGPWVTFRIWRELREHAERV
jgi:hypothetical protein